MVQRLARDLPPASPRFELETVLGSWPQPQRFPPHVERVRLQRLLIPTEPGLTVPAFLLRPPGKVRGVVVAIDDRGKEALGTDPVVLEAFERGWTVCGIDPRGIGESATAKTGWVFAVSLLLGENFVGRQAFDLSRVIADLDTADAFPGKPAGIYARGPNASLLAIYALARDSLAGADRSRLKWSILRDGFLSYRAFFERPGSLRDSYRLMPDDGNRSTSFDREIPATFFVFDVLRSWDLPQLLASSHAAGLIVNPVDGDGNRLPESVAQKLQPGHIRVVSGADPGEAIRRFLQDVLAERRLAR
jgi:hypothetical protein